MSICVICGQTFFALLTVEKKEAFAVEAAALQVELVQTLNLRRVN
jgi:hypothetical protein